MNAEYQAARESTAFLDLSARGKIEVTGADRVSFRHNILTQDIKNLKTGSSCPAALLSAPAKVLALMNVWKMEDKILLDTDPGFEKKLAGLLEKFLITEDVQLEIATAKYSDFLIKGPKAGDLLGHFDDPPYFWRGGKIQGFLGLWPRKDSIAIRNKLTAAGAVPISAETEEILRIEEGILRYGVDVTEEISVPETGLDDLYASETKGCYPGQEVVARTKTYKGLQRKITGVVFSLSSRGAQRREISEKWDFSSPSGVRNDMPKRSDKIYFEEKEIGWITSACVSPALGGIALGYVVKGFFFVEGGEEQIEVQIKTNSEIITAKITTLPFLH